MTAEADVRARRRYKELLEKGMQVGLDEITANIRMRDNEDENRKESPLRRAVDAVMLDNSHMTIDQQMEWFRKLWIQIIQRYEH
jgi:cytidylate kinase